MKKIILIALIGIQASLSGCTPFPYESDLLISVRGLLSGNPRDGILVQVFESEYDAEHSRYAISPRMITDDFGEVLLVGLEPGRKYFVRIDALLTSKVRSTGKLRNGSNHCIIRIL